MDTKPARSLRAARKSGEPGFITTSTRVESTGLVIPPIRAEVKSLGWRLERDWDCSAGDCKLILPRGWETDLATVPRLLKRFFNSFEFGVTGPLVHDFLYDHAGCPPEGSCEPWRRFERKEVDRLMVRLMKEERVSPWRRLLGYAVTRLAGWTHWGEPNRARRDGG